TQGFVHAGIALCLAGDETLGKKALETALSKSRQEHVYYGDYGSNLRDNAVSYYLVSHFYPSFSKKTDFLFHLQDDLLERQWLSTQERNALVLAGSISLKDKGETWQARVTTGEKTQDLIQNGIQTITSLKGASSAGFKIVNKWEKDLFLSVAMVGYPAQRPEPEEKEVKITRRYLDMTGNPIEKMDFVSGDRILVEVGFSITRRLPDGLIVDLLPSGLELEDPNLAGSSIIDEISVDKKTVAQWHKQFIIRHTEYRDDRFVAAVDARPKRTFRIFYPVRVVSPGEYIVPPTLVEDMYRPYIRGIGDTRPLIRISNP
ncbi:MAG: alpha-2-macroglobulin family protein, partial [Desulfobacteraceae bacterium]|nr:alpha-2-macroglobulin family protein [Desulfobacteraceae bacterium]